MGGGVLKNGTWIDCYNNLINYDISGTILAVVNSIGDYYVAVEEEDERIQSDRHEIR